METYTTLDGRVLDLISLSAEEQRYFERCYQAYLDGAGWVALSRLVDGSANPLLGPTGGWITPQVWDSPLFQAVRDLEGRAGIRSGELLPGPGQDPDRDPLDDAWLPLPAAAREKGVRPAGLHKAVTQGEALARPAKPGGVRLLISRNSLEHWRPNSGRQARSNHHLSQAG